jgi:hypothetical protein
MNLVCGRTFVLCCCALLINCGSNASNKPLGAAEAIKATAATLNLPQRSVGFNYHLDAIGPVASPAWAHSVRVPSQDLAVAGWAIDEPNNALAGNVDFVIDHVPFGARYGVARQDVAAYFKNPAYTNSGFQFTIPASLMTKGVHSFSLRFVANDGKSFAGSPEITLQVQ